MALSKIIRNLRDVLLKTKQHALYPYLYNKLIRRFYRKQSCILLMLPMWWSVILGSLRPMQIIKYFTIFSIGIACVYRIYSILNNVILKAIIFRTKLQKCNFKDTHDANTHIKRSICELLILSILVIVLLFTLPVTAVKIGAIWLVCSFTYLFVKKWIGYQFIIRGFIYNIGIFMSWFSVTQFWSITPALLYISSVLCTIGHNIVYNSKRMPQGVNARSKEVILKLGNPESVRRFYTLSGVCLGIVGINNQMNLLFYAILCCAVYMLYLQTEKIEMGYTLTKIFNFNIYSVTLVTISFSLGKF
ncbi:membrane hypothetical protein [Alphaproteobacteria bacterium]